MPSPYPGMDPYLESPGLWEEVHTGLIVAIQQHLSPLVRPRFRVAVERRTYLELVEMRPELEESEVPLNALLHQLYDRAGYDLAVDYTRPLDP